MTSGRSITIIGIAALSWNLIGDASFIAQYSMDLTILARSDPDTARIFAQMPLWAWAIYAVAVFGATIGTILLLMRRAIAVPLYALSVVAIIALFSHSFFATDLLAVKGWTATLFPALIFLIGVAQLLYARALVAKRVLR